MEMNSPGEMLVMTVTVALMGGFVAVMLFPVTSNPQLALRMFLDAVASNPLVAGGLGLLAVLVVLFGEPGDGSGP